MRFNEFNILAESRGVTARSPGETYVSTTDPEDVLTFQGVTVIPNNAPAFNTSQEMLDAVEKSIPPGIDAIEDNKPNKGTKAAIIAQLTDTSGQSKVFIKYIKQVPPQGVNGMWDTIKGYKYGKSAKTENIPIKPTDVIKDAGFRKPTQLASEVKAGVRAMVQGTPYEAISNIMDAAVDQALRGSAAPIKGGAEYATIIAKYGGEYLGPLAITAGNVRKGDIEKMLNAYGLKNLANASISFPQDTANELVDSIIKAGKGVEIGISTKMAKGGGAASSLSGVAKQLNDNIRQTYPNGSQVIETLGKMGWMDGPLEVAKMYGILTDADVQAMKALDKASRNVRDIKSATIQQLVAKQNVAKDTFAREDYRVMFHAMAAIVNTMAPIVNQDQEFRDAMKAALNNNNFLQLLTNVKTSGDSITLDYFGKYPAVFEGNPQLFNKTYFATGNKGRIGFKLL